MSNQNKQVPFLIKQEGDIVMYLNGETMTVSIAHPNYSKVVAALKSGQYSLIENLVDVAKAVVNYAGGKVKIENGQIYFSGSPVHNTLATRILKMMEEGFKFDHMVLFLENLMLNPSFRAVNETYTFLENNGLPITEDGCFLAYKAVKNNYTDIRTGKFDNHVGQQPSMPRNQVDENYEQDCSSGLHVGALEYVVSFGAFVKGQFVGTGGNRLLIVKVNPRDVVSVPRYAGHTKMRVSTYKVLSEVVDVVKELDKIVYKSDGSSLPPDQPKTPAPKVQAVDSNDYEGGFEAGEEDRFDGESYGTSRDYSLKGSYLSGYNDAYNGRARSTVCSQPAQVEDGSPETENENEYLKGYDLGVADYQQGRYEGYSLDFDVSDKLKLGYYDGYGF